MKLRKPKRNLWNAAFILFIIGIILAYAPFTLPAFFIGWAFWLMVASAALLLLGTTVL